MGNRPLTAVDGVDYTPAGIRALHREVARIRGDVLAACEFDDAVILTHACILLSHLADLVQAKGFPNANASVHVWATCSCPVVNEVNQAHTPACSRGVG